MKIQFNHPFAKTAALIALILTLQRPAHADTDDWDLKQAETSSDGKITIRGNSGRYLRIEDPGITIVDDAQSPGEKALLFSGTQTKAVVASKVYEEGSSVSLKLKVKPAGDGGEDIQTVLVRPGKYELRYYAKRGELEALVSCTEKPGAVTVRAPLAADRWNEVELSAKGSDILLKVDGTAFTAKLPEGAILAATRSYFRLGRIDQSRPFKGMLTGISVSEPAE